MKILLTNHFPLAGSGSGVYVTNIAQDLAKNGHEVCIIMPENTTRIKKIPNVKIHPVYFKRKEKIEGQLDFNFVCFDWHPRSSLLFSTVNEEQIKQYEEAFKKAIEEEIREFKPDIIHAQHIWIISSIAVEYGIPVIITCHGSDLMGYNESNRYHNYVKKAADSCEKIIAISNDSKEELDKIFKEHTNKIITMPNGYDPNVFYREECNKDEILSSFSINKKFDKIVCFVGRLTKNKGIDILLKSAKIYEKENILTIIAGDGKEYDELYAIKEKLQLQNVVFVGDQNQESLRKIYSISDVCVVPSRKEAFGLVALESIACGTPVIATNQGGIPDFVTKEVGILVEQEDVQQLADKINKVLNGKLKFDVDYLKNYAKNNYSQENLINKLIEIYSKI